MREVKIEAPGVAAPGGFSEQKKSKYPKRITYQKTQNNNRWSLLDLLPDLKRTGASRGGPEYHGPCWSCGGTDRLAVWPEQGKTGRYWCRQCGKRGDAIQLLRDRDGLSFRDAKRALGFSCDGLSSEAIKKQQAQRTALTAAYEDYKTWARRMLVALTDKYRELLAELDTAETAYRQIQRCPDLYPDKDEALDWIWQMYSIRERLATLEPKLDILTYHKHELDCVRWWKQAMEGGEDAIRHPA